ncbi:uncharacterized protein LOC121997793 isoform X2 [Zingiber officinale]|uniref:Single-stranded nucleic acid binding R3H protein n=1 Tax=Zingiber officinale TaxID=94328 RepID=A0A8J5GIC7_ZINOF|nr:uncharacterized protein LOC121997793 isoform X2 [Zingiber officinale]KAG6501257.1 hypothetical protein ZIOFF_041135 [Zingiber officinale]
MEPSATGAASIESHGFQDKVDCFLLEALENPRHRLTVLRMEFDIQRFMQNSDQHQYEFQHLPTSYLRCAAHRVAQHYGLLTTGIESTTVGLGSTLIAQKTPNSKFPVVLLSEIAVKQTEKETSGPFKIVLRPRPAKASPNADIHFGHKKDAVKSVEERKEEYNRARARIFNGSNSLDMDAPSAASTDSDEQELLLEEIERIHIKDGSYRVAIFRDREKDRSDPDYDRSYERYVRGPTPSQVGLQAGNSFQPAFLQYDANTSFNHLPRNESCFGPNPSMNPFCTSGYNQTTKDAFCMQWPSPAMMYAYSYEPFRQVNFQAPPYQQPLSFDHPRN